MAATTLTDDDGGERSVTSNGEEIGTVTKIESTTAHVDPDVGVTDTIRSELGWEDADECEFVLQEDRIETVTDIETRLTD